MTIYQMQLGYATKASLPDSWDTDLFPRHSPDHVVSKDDNGKVLSVYGDLSWDRTPYSEDKRRFVLHFDYWTKGNIDLHPARRGNVEHMKWIVFLLLYMKSGSPLKAGITAYMQCLRQFAKYAETKGIPLSDAYPFWSHADNVVKTSGIKAYAALIAFVHGLGAELTGIEIDIESLAKHIKKRALEYNLSLKQTPPIPTRIYSAILSRLSSKIDEYASMVDNMIAMWTDGLTHPYAGYAESTRKNIAINLRANSQVAPPLSESFTFDQLLERHGLEDYWQGTGFSRDWNGVGKWFTFGQSIATLQIQAHTGMRGDEADYLPLNALEEQKINGDNRVHYVLKGRVTKDGRRIVRWVTSNSGKKAAHLAEKIALFIYKNLEKTDALKDQKTADRHLFIRFNALGRSLEAAPRSMYLKQDEDLFNFLAVPIEQADLEELYEIEPHRHWEQEDDFGVGKPWPLARHQLRRSLALYAQRSGLVSLPALKGQLQHITEEMSSYYARGSAFAKNFIVTGSKNEKHIGTEWQEAEPLSAALSLVKHVLMNNQTDNFGTKMLWLYANHSDEDGNLTLSREETIDLVKKGMLTYRETPIGGCTLVGKCDTPPLTLLHTDCMKNHCRNMIGSITKLERVIAIKSVQVGKIKIINPDAWEVRVEEGELSALEAGLVEAKKEIAKRSASNAT